MKKFFRLVVFMMCIAWLLSLLGCGKGHLVDGPGMERGVWSEFTLSRCSETFETVYRYTVHYDEDLNEAELYIEVYEGRTVDKRAKVDKETISKLYNLDLLFLPEAEPVDGNFLGLSVTDRNGQTYSKQISKAKEEAVLAILAPYLTAEEEDPFMLDGPSMEYTPPWTAFTVSRSDSNAQYIFWFTVMDGDPDALVTGECRDKDGGYFEEEAGIPISAETLQALQWMNLEQLPEEEEWPEDLERPLDDSTITLSVTLSDGTVIKKQASGELSMEIYQLLLPYFINNQS